MAAIVLELQPGDIERVVEWFSTQDPPAPYDHGDTSAGQEAYAAAGCATCHDAADKALGVPHLTAQHAGYLIKQMEDFLSGARVSQMNVDHSALLPKGSDVRDAIARYLASQPRQ